MKLRLRVSTSEHVSLEAWVLELLFKNSQLGFQLLSHADAVLSSANFAPNWRYQAAHDMNTAGPLNLCVCHNIPQGLQPVGLQRLLQAGQQELQRLKTMVDVLEGSQRRHEQEQSQQRLVS